jgi:hypothetical protein
MPPQAPVPFDMSSDEHRSQEPKMVQNNLCQWSLVEGNQFVASGTTFPALQTGMYAIRWYKGVPAFERRDLALDELYVFPGSIAETVLVEVHEFWSTAAKYAAHNLLHRRGFLFHGSQGHGKTSVIKMLMEDMITNRAGIILLCNTDPDLIDLAVQHIRQVEPQRNLMCVYEDIDALIESWGEEHILSILDGENQTNHVLNVATSNHPDKLDYRLTNRPRRFDTIIKMGVVNREERQAYFAKKTKFTSDAEQQQWLDSSSEFSFAALAEMVIAIRILNHDFGATIKRLTAMMKNKAVKGDDSNFGY